jgi:hypothetical protein
MLAVKLYLAIMREDPKRSPRTSCAGDRYNEFFGDVWLNDRKARENSFRRRYELRRAFAERQAAGAFVGRDDVADELSAATGHGNPTESLRLTWLVFVKADSRTASAT